MTDTHETTCSLGDTSPVPQGTAAHFESDDDAGTRLEIILTSGGENVEACFYHLDCADSDLLVLCELEPGVQRTNISRAGISRAADASDNASSA